MIRSRDTHGHLSVGSERVQSAEGGAVEGEVGEGGEAGDGSRGSHDDGGCPGGAGRDAGTHHRPRHPSAGRSSTDGGVQRGSGCAKASEDKVSTYFPRETKALATISRIQNLHCLGKAPALYSSALAEGTRRTHFTVRYNIKANLKRNALVSARRNVPGTFHGSL